MKCDIFIRSYENDAEWLKYCIKSIKKYSKNFNNIVLTFPKNHLICKNINAVNFYIDPIHIDDYIDQQITKLTANKFCHEDTTHIMFVDSDCCFHDYFSPNNYIDDGKIIYPIGKYTEMKKNNDSGYMWKKYTESILNIDIEFEFMRRQPLMFKKKSLENLQKWFLENKKEKLEDNLKKIKNREISEFNLLGAFTYYIEKDSDYLFTENLNNFENKNPCHQFRSWDGITKDIKFILEKITND